MLIVDTFYGPQINDGYLYSKVYWYGDSIYHQRSYSASLYIEDITYKIKRR